jgi:hypothetical protein
MWPAARMAKDRHIPSTAELRVRAWKDMGRLARVRFATRATAILTVRPGSDAV